MDDLEHFPGDRLLSLELAANEHTGRCRVSLSLPGRPGAVTRVWRPVTGQRLSEDQVTDLLTWLGNVGEEFLLTSMAPQQLWQEAHKVSSALSKYALGRDSHLPSGADKPSSH